MEKNLTKLLVQYNFPEEATNLLLNKLRSAEIRKNEYFVQYGEKMNRIGILLSGSLISRYSSADGIEVASKFYTTNSDFIITDYYCFKNQLNSSESIQAVEDSKVLVLSYDDFQALSNESPVIQKLISRLLEENYLNAINRVRDFQLLSAEERVLKFMQVHHKNANKFMIKDKASYLGISRNVFTNKMKNI